MQTLPTTFRSDGFDFTQLKRQGDVILFQKTKPRHIVTHYEVVIVQHAKAKTMPSGLSYPDREVMPHSDDDWGTYGWTPFDLEAAERRFTKTVNAVQEAGNLPHPSGNGEL